MCAEPTTQVTPLARRRRRRPAWLGRRAVLGLCLTAPALAHAWLGPADPILEGAEGAIRSREAREVIARTLTRGGARRVDRWRFGPDCGGNLPSTFEHDILHWLLCRGVVALAAHLAIDQKERRMALVDGHPTQVIGRPERAALWIDHPHGWVRRVARGADDLRLSAWDGTARAPLPLRLEYRRAGRWQRVLALEPVPA